MMTQSLDCGQAVGRRQVVRLYWNHICILHNFEKAYLARLVERLAERGIDLQVTYFGLGYATHMAEYLAQDDAVLPDMIVSADLEVFEHPRVADKLSGRYACEGWEALKDTPAVRAVRRDETLLPVVIIPIVLYGADCTGFRLLDIARARRLAFGGINNSAGKTLVKAAWSRYGRDAAAELLDRAFVADMPIGAYQAVRTGGADVAPCRRCMPCAPTGRWPSKAPRPRGPCCCPRTCSLATRYPRTWRGRWLMGCSPTSCWGSMCPTATLSPARRASRSAPVTRMPTRCGPWLPPTSRPSM